LTAYDELSDSDLVARCRAGDETAWATLVQRFSRYVHAIATQAFRLSDHDAEDVFQEVFARTYSHLDRLRDDGAIRPWLAQLTRNLCLDRIRETSRTQPAEEIDPGGVDETLSNLDEALTVHEALEALGTPCHDLLDRFFAQDQSYHTISAELDLPSGTIASRISRCLTKLRGELEGRNDSSGPSGGQ
jgi:RNA polymerase sigma-70 factor (ECF subfamily)